MAINLAKLTEQMNNAVSHVQRRNEQLEFEVASLRAQLAAPTGQEASALNSGKRKRTSTDNDPARQAVSLQDYQDLEQKYEQLKQDRDEQVSALTGRWRKARKVVQQWQQYCDEMFARKDKRDREEAAAASHFDPMNRLVQAGSNAAEPVLPRVSGAVSSALVEDSGLTPRPSTTLGVTSLARQDHPRSKLQRHPSTQSTDVPSSPPPSSPQKLHSTTISVGIKQERRTQSQPFDIPSGGNSSPFPKEGMSKEISDLDAAPEMDLGEGNGPHNNRYPAPVSARGFDPPVNPHLEEQPPCSGPDDIRDTDTTMNEAHQPDALRPLSVNVPIPPINGGKERRRSSRSPNSMHDKIVALAEAGDDGHSQLHRPQKNGNKKPGISDDARRRLELMLAQSQQEETPALSKRLPSDHWKDRDQFTTPSSLKNPGVASVRSLPASKRPITPQSKVTEPQAARFVQTDLKRRFQKPVPKGSPEKVVKPSLRSLPVQDLKISDFKINPRFQGTDYAFADTIRGKEQRRCLGGCTRPDCCGPGLRSAFQLMGGGSLTSKKTDREALEAYLGSNWQDTMKTYSNEDRQRTLNEAHFTAFANDMGKHRTAFEKQLEPPGYWETEMPSTQQAKEYRELADQQEREKIEGRWREAMAGNGRWIFQDGS